MVERLEVSLPPSQDPSNLGERDWEDISRKYLDLNSNIKVKVEVEKFSFDARRQPMQWIVNLNVFLNDEKEPKPDFSLVDLKPISAPQKKAIIIGAGPAGLFAALDLISQEWEVTIVERGSAVQKRRKDIAAIQRGLPANVNSNYAFGEGGAGTYSDGKLYTRSLKRGSIKRVIDTLIGYGAPEVIRASWRPHIGSNLLPKIIAKITEHIQKAGGRILYESEVTAILQDEGKCTGVELASGEKIYSDATIYACGHSALDSLLMAEKAGAKLEPKGFAMGIRIEHPQAWLDELQYNSKREEFNLEPAFYSLATQINERGVFSFCMCPGGWVVPAQVQDHSLVMNGMSLSKRDSDFANSGIVVAIEPKDWCGKRGWRWGWPSILKKAAAISDHPMLHEIIQDPRGGQPIPVAEGRLPIHPEVDPLFGVRLQIALEALSANAGGGANKAPVQRADLFINNLEHQNEVLPNSYLPGVTPTNLHEIMPKGMAVRLTEALQEFDDKLPGFAGAFGLMFAFETRTSSPVRIMRDSRQLEALGLKGLFPCGEGAGYAGGIMSAALDGLRCAEAIKQTNQDTLL